MNYQKNDVKNDQQNRNKNSIDKITWPNFYDSF